MKITLKEIRCPECSRVYEFTISTPEIVQNWQSLKIRPISMNMNLKCNCGASWNISKVIK